jgi:hypothetical protein
MKFKYIIFLVFTAIITLISCTGPGEVEGHDFQPAEEIQVILPPSNNTVYEVGDIPETDLIHAQDLIYRGYFRLPEGSGGSDWDYSGHGLTYYPDGDPSGDSDGYPGSLFGFGHDHQLYVSEISIPAPMITNDLPLANIAITIQPFSDLTDGIFRAEEMVIPRAGIAFLAQPQPRLHFTFGQHIQDFEVSHGWAGLDLDQPDAKGPWVFDGYTNYITNDYLFEIPPDWAEAIAPGPLLASGRAREGLWSGRGPGLFAYRPGDIESPPSAGAVLPDVIPLLLYGEQNAGQPEIISSPDQAVTDYREADHWWGGAWLTDGDGAAVIFAGTKALGNEWYGFANGVVWEHDCAENAPPTCPDVPDWPYDNRGFWADSYQAQLIFYDPTELVAVTRGEVDSWEPQIYDTLVLDEYLLDPALNHGDYKRDLVGAVAFDRENGFLYLVERMADEYRSVIHVWEISR